MLRHIPELVAWGIGIVLAVLMVGRGGGRAEKLFLAGCSLIFITNLASPILSELMRRLVTEQGMTNASIAQTMGWVSIPLGLLGLAGLVCLVWAFWVRFWIRKQETA